MNQEEPSSVIQKWITWVAQQPRLVKIVFLPQNTTDQGRGCCGTNLRRILTERPASTSRSCPTCPGQLLAVPDPVPGKTHDRAGFSLAGYDNLLDDIPTLGDLSYQGNRRQTGSPGLPTRKVCGTISAAGKALTRHPRSGGRPECSA